MSLKDESFEASKLTDEEIKSYINTDDNVTIESIRELVYILSKLNFMTNESINNKT